MHEDIKKSKIAKKLYFKINSFIQVIIQTSYQNGTCKSSKTIIEFIRNSKCDKKTQKMINTTS